MCSHLRINNDIIIKPIVCDFSDSGSHSYLALMKNKKVCWFALLFFCIGNSNGFSQSLSLAGYWNFKMDSGNKGLSERWFDQILSDSIALPGSCEQAGFGIKNNVKDKDRLTRPFKYEGKAWYQKTIIIPSSWSGKRLELFLERCHWESAVWLDGKPFGIRESLSSPHRYDFGYVEPGLHRITICIDNTYKLPIGPWGFAITEDTQGNWNGIIGQIALLATDPVWIRDVQVYKNHLQVRIGNITGKPVQAAISGQHMEIPINGTTIDLPFAHPANSWSEFSPALDTLTLKLEAAEYADQKTIVYGVRELGTKNGQFTVNGKPVIIRGPVNECIYPLTGYPPMDKGSWLKLFKICASYGFNFMRFNSWCPPEASFEAADEMGFLLQVELPFWSMDAPAYGEDPPRDQFLENELYAILRDYGNHPSFGFMAMGNESPGPMDVLVHKGKAVDSRMLYRCQDGDTITKGDYAERGTEIGQRGVKGPRTDWNRWTLTPDSLTASYQHSAMPVMAHEVGQWGSYPDFSQIAKFTGVLKPYNYERFHQSLVDHHMEYLAKDFAMASGQFAVSIYKDEIEGCLRTYPHGGFQIVEARDFPGEGVAIIGWLDAFWDSKGLISPKEFRRFCGPTVCLLEMPKRIYTNEESFVAAAEIAHYGQNDLALQPTWKIENEKGILIATGILPINKIPAGKLTKLGGIKASLKEIREPARLMVTLSAGTCSNSWNIWVYPQTPPPAAGKLKIAYAFNEETRQALLKGENVLLFSSPRQGLNEIKPGFGYCFGWLSDSLAKDNIQFPPVQKGRSAIPGSFLPAFWSMRLFNQIGTLGILCDPKHPALEAFPTEQHSDWEWADIIGRYTSEQSYEISTDMRKHPWGDVYDRSKAIILNETAPGFRPIVQVIDNYERNYKLGLIFETRVGKGNLLVCAADLDTDADTRPAARQLKKSLIQYASGRKFNPQDELPMALLEKILTY